MFHGSLCLISPSLLLKIVTGIILNYFFSLISILLANEALCWLWKAIFYKHALNRGYVTAHHHFEALYKCNDTLFEQFDEYTKQVNQHHYISDSDSFKRNQEESSKAIRKIVNESSIEQTEKRENHTDNNAQYGFLFSRSEV